MTTGTVNAALEATIPLLVHGRGTASQVIDAVIDTGFNGGLTMPPTLIKALQLPWVDRILGVLADGSQQAFDVYSATVEWNGQPRVVQVSEADSPPLMGMEFLLSHELRVVVVQGGIVTVDAIP